MFFIHPKNVGMTYSEHFIFSIKLSFIFFEGFYKAIIHGIIPDIFINSSTELSKDILNKISLKLNDKKLNNNKLNNKKLNNKKLNNKKLNNKKLNNNILNDN